MTQASGLTLRALHQEDALRKNSEMGILKPVRINGNATVYTIAVNPNWDLQFVYQIYPSHSQQEKRPSFFPRFDPAISLYVYGWPEQRLLSRISQHDVYPYFTIEEGDKYIVVLYAHSEMHAEAILQKMEL